VPTLIITALDDPFIPVEPFRDPSVGGNPAIRLIITPHGGHCGFVSTPVRGSVDDGSTNGADDGYWAERMVVAFVKARANTNPA
jgi:uncharacterized protein